MKVLITPEEIKKRVGEMAQEIAKTYPNEPITIVGVLTGCLVLVADLIRQLNQPVRIAFIQASSYRGAVTSPGQLKIFDDLLPDVRGRHLLLVDDILDTGKTLAHLVRHLHNLEPATLRVCVLLRKRARQAVPFEPEFFGFDIPDEFVVGYGMDYNDEYRHLPFIGVLEESDQKKNG